MGKHKPLSLDTHKYRTTFTSTTKLVLRFSNFNYRSAVGKLNYLAQTMRPDIMYATHQIAKYSSNPRQSHGEAILYLVCYLKKTRDLGLKFKPDPKKGFECYCDANFSGNWNKAFAPVDPSTSKS